jgi:hypothetical protein
MMHLRPSENVARHAAQRIQFAANQIADPLDTDIRRGVRRDVLRIERVMSLSRKDGRQTIAPDVLHSRKNAQLVVDLDVVTGEEGAIDMEQKVNVVGCCHAANPAYVGRARLLRQPRARWSVAMPRSAAPSASLYTFIGEAASASINKGNMGTSDTCIPAPSTGRGHSVRKCR